MSLRTNIKRGKIIINPNTTSGTSIFFTEGFFLNPPAVNLTPSTNVLTYLEETSNTHFSIRVSSNLNQNITIHYVAIERLTYEESTMSARDFLATRTRTESIIGGGSTQKLVVYSGDNATDNIGGVNTALQSRISSLGNEVYFYVDGVPNGKENNTTGSVAAFGGDVVITGKLYADTVISTVESTTMWEPDDDDPTNNLTMSGIMDSNNGVFSFDFISNAYTLSARPQIAINDSDYEFDSDGNVMPRAL
tara:strand:+ start:25703 stop:26449 length:747 start_codon:yes stop_codon:yes gene_type:complete